MMNLSSLKHDLRDAQNKIENIRTGDNASPREIGDAMKALADVVGGVIEYIDDAERERDRAISSVIL